jgi:uncharacterized oligopeptide transporter (OPT) family protein
LLIYFSGFVGIIPALASIGHPLNYWQLTLWAMGVAFFGVFFAVPLRTQTVITTFTSHDSSFS